MKFCIRLDRKYCASLTRNCVNYSIVLKKKLVRLNIVITSSSSSSGSRNGRIVIRLFLPMIKICNMV
jgi:hypothetical protein